jgi:hypothetical protein
MATTPAEAAGNEQIQTLNAQFVDFSLGDTEHYIFKDKAGKTWEFGGCDDQTVKFGKELPASEANETNQGWGVNKDLQNKWFDLKYVVRKQALYQDGPEGDVPVIVEAKMAQ